MKSTILIIITLITFKVNSQPWLHEYGQNWSYRNSTCVINDYDKGYLLSANVANGAYDQHCLIYKIDDNGYIVYEKLIGSGINEQGRYDIISLTEDGGILLPGGCWGDNMDVNPSLIKLDECRNKVWCATLNNNLIDQDFFWDAVETTDSSVVAVSIQNDQDYVNYPLHLHKFSSTGEQIWRKRILGRDQHPLLYGPDPWDLDLLSDGTMILSGLCYWPNPGSIEYGYIRMFVAKFDSNGNEIWLYVHGLNDYQYSLASYSVVIGDNIYTDGASYLSDSIVNFPNLFKVNTEGILQGSYPLNIPTVDGKNSMGPFLISDISEGHFFGSTTMYNEEEYYGYNAFIKIDTSGNLIDFFMPEDSLNLRIHGFPIITKNNSVLVNSNNTGETYSQCDAYALRLLTDSLRFDSIPYSNFEYDSLCDQTILSSTVALDSCTIVVNNDDYLPPLHGTRLIMMPSPVPAKDKLIIKLQNSTQFNDINIKFYGTHGEQISDRRINRGINELKMEILNWSAGIYIAVAYSNSVQIGSCKFIITK